MEEYGFKNYGKFSVGINDLILICLTGSELFQWRNYACCVTNTGTDLVNPDNSYDVSKFLASEAERSERKKAAIRPGENASR